MARLSIQERIFIVEIMIQTKSVADTRRKFKTRFGFEINRKTISTTLKKWKQEGSVKDLHRGNSGRKKSARTDENKEKIQSLVSSDCQISIRKIAAASNMKRTSVHNILKKDLGLKSYKPQVSQELMEGDDVKRLAFCNKIEQMMQEGLNPGDIIFSDESHVYLKSSPNKQNTRSWGLSKPEKRTSVPLHSAKVTVWCGLNSTKVIGPFFFEDAVTGTALTITKERYTEMLIDIFPDDSNDVTSRTIFMQDGAPAHTSRMAMDWLETRFQGKLISNKSDFIWPPRSPDLNPLDFFLWGYMKQKIHEAHPGSLAEVKQLIEDFMASISQDLLQRVMNQFCSRIRKCIEARGGVFE